MTNTASHPSAELAAFASTLRYEAIPDAVLRRCEDFLLDTLASILAGARSRPVLSIEKFARAMGPADGPSEVLVSRRKTSPFFAAMVNAASAHMVEHMLLVMVIPIFLVLAAPVTLALRALPSRADGSRGPREWILAIVGSHVARFMSNPIVAAVNFAGSMIVFYYSGLFGLALSTYVGHVAMVVHFSLAGYLFANAIIGVDPGPTRPGYPQRILLLFATMGFHAFFGVTLMSSEVLLVPEWFGVLGRPWGLSAIADQQRGGAIAWGIGELPTLALALAVAFAWARSDERTARNRDRRVDRDGDPELDEYNAMLATMARHDAPPGRDVAD